VAKLRAPLTFLHTPAEKVFTAQFLGFRTECRIIL